MKQCPRCRQTYVDEQLNYCLEDGEPLTDLTREPAPGRYSNEPPPARYVDDAPPTVMLNESRVTNPAAWPQASPAVWQQQGNEDMQQRPPFAAMPFGRSMDTTLPKISLILGIASIVLACCYGGIWLGLPAAVLGYLGMRNADTDPGRYSGRGLAIGGMVLGGISFLASIIFGFFAILAS